MQDADKDRVALLALLRCGCAARLDALEEKIDACLVLLRVATSHDKFAYTLSDKSPLWDRAIHGAQVVVSHVTERVASIYQEYQKVVETEGLRSVCHSRQQVEVSQDSTATRTAPLS